MQTNQVEGPIEAPENPDFAPACNWLRVNSFHGLSPSWRWGIGVIDDPQKPESNFRELMSGNDAMTADQWSNWTDQATDPYVLECAAANLGLTLAPVQAAKTGAKKTRSVR